MNKKILLSIATVCFWGLILKSQVPKWVKSAHPDGLQVNGVVFGGDGQSILTGTNCHPAKLRRYNTADGALSWDYTVSETLNCMMGVSLSSNERYFTSVEENGHLLIFDYLQPQPTLLKTLNLGTAYAFSVDFSPNSESVAVGCSSGKLQAYEISGNALWSVAAHTSWVTSVDYSPDGNLVASGGSDNKVKIWKADGTPFKTLNGHAADITAVRFTPDNLRLVSASQDNKVRIWDVQSGTLLKILPVSTEDVLGLALSNDGSYLATIAGYELKIWQMSDYSLLETINIAAIGFPTSISWSPVESSVAIGTDNGKIALYEIETSATSTRTAMRSVQAKAYPNPCTDFVQLNWPSTENIAQIDLYDAQGQLLKSISDLAGQNNLRLPLGAYTPSAFFTLRLLTTDGRSGQQVLLHH